MIVIGLTGSIGMGKTTLTRQLAALGAKVCHADAIVHRLMAKGGAGVAGIQKAFPKAVQAGAVDRKILGEIVFNDAKKRKILEEILHPLVIAAENDFIEKHKRKGVKIVVLDIPLLFETGGHERCDITIVASAPEFLQAQRVLKRQHMTPEKLKAVRAAQMPNREKQALGDFIVQTGLGRGYSFRKLKILLEAMHAA